MPEELRILHLQDALKDAMLLQGVLEADGIACDISHVSTRDAFTTALEAGGVDLILADYALPGFDGRAALEIARRIRPEVPFILVSGTIGEEAAIESLKNGATDYIFKQNISRLAPAVRRALHEAAERRNRRAAEEALQQERCFLRAVIESLEVGIVACDAEGALTFFNRASLEMHGLPQEPLPPEQWVSHYRLCEADGRTPLESEAFPLHRALQGKPVRNEEIVILPREGAACSVLVSGQLITGAHGEKLGAVVAITDITERKRLEGQYRQAQKMEAVGRLAGGVAHDFNNLLTVIMGYSSFLQKRLGPEHPSYRDAVEIHKAGGRAAALTRQLLAFTRQQVVEAKVLDLNAAIGELDKMLRRLIGEDVELVTLPGTDLGHVKADPGQVDQVIVNLVLNARDAMPGGGRLTIEMANVDLDEDYASSHLGVQPGRYVMLTVTDSGCGMDAETKARVFEPFFTTKESGKGTGLGLATVYGIVKQAGGHVEFYSEPGWGATFKVYLPRVEEAVEPQAPPVAAVEPRQGSGTVLLVEDEELVRGVVRHALRSLGYTVREAATPDDAVRLFDQDHVSQRFPVHFVVHPVLDNPEK